MAISLMNGLSSMGAGIASFAGTAGLEAQKADLAQQGMKLADQLQHASRTAEITQQGTIAEAAATQAQAAQKDITGMQISGQLEATQVSASATLGAAGINAAAAKYSADIQRSDTLDTLANAKPEQAARILAQNQQTALMAVQAQNAADLRDAHSALEAETAKATPDPAKISTLTNQITSLETSAGTQAAIVQAAAGMYRTDMDNVQSLNTRLVAATTAMNSPEMTDTAKAQQQGVIDQLKTQMVGAQRALDYSSALIHGRVAAATNTPPPGVGGGPVDLTKFLKQPAGVNPATPSPAAPAAGPRPGLMNYSPDNTPMQP